jgi:hypothetical protein
MTLSTTCHSNTPSLQDVDDDTVEAFANLSGNPYAARNLTEEHKAQTLEDTLKWLRKRAEPMRLNILEMLGTLTQLARN